uniref:Acyl-lipid 8-desaturase n=1 Tax=Rebecca salina TaxID=561169 RepID=D8FAD_REBSA|nr:RecName: Full=Acyl-lipid 8-desaturase; AltName: Full=Delta-8 desaturase [Rebecca salina]ABL96296.1 delta-8 desaturase [Rebecca salina]
MGRGGDSSGQAHPAAELAVPSDRAEVSNADSKALHIVLYGKRVDVTKFQRTHPGGSKVFRIFQDRDATEQFESYHSKRAIKMMEGMLKKSEDAPADTPLPSQSPMGKDFKAMIERHVAAGYYDPCPLDELFKLSLVLLPTFAGMYMLKAGVGSPLCGALMVSFGWYLDGWLAHDYLHHSVFKGSVARTVGWNNAAGYFLGFVQGYAVEWWRARHNTHHVCTNEDGSDPDIKTAPLLIYVRNKPSIAKRLNAFQRYQQYYYVPVMAILDLYWRLESIAYVAMRLPKMLPQALALVAHYAIVAWVFAGNYHLLPLVTVLRGFGTGITVFATHYGEDILDADQVRHMTLVEQTALTSRNISGGWLVNVLTGFISLQTEHHLFPMMPTGNLMTIQPEVRAFFKKHGLEYREGNLIECVRQNIRALAFEHLL